MMTSDGRTDSSSDVESLNLSGGLACQPSSSRMSSQHGGHSGLPLLSGQGGTQPKSNTKQGNTAGAAISQMAGPT